MYDLKQKSKFRIAPSIPTFKKLKAFIDSGGSEEALESISFCFNSFEKFTQVDKVDLDKHLRTSQHGLWINCQ